MNTNYVNLKKNKVIKKNKKNFEKDLKKINNKNLKSKLENLINAFNYKN